MATIGKNIPQQSAILKWSPYLDELGILRVKGRVDLIRGVAVKRPVILPKNHPVTRLIIDFYHKKFHHHHIHIEIAPSLSTESFLFVPKQFVCRRGIPKRIVSLSDTQTFVALAEHLSKRLKRCRPVT